MATKELVKIHEVVKFPDPVLAKPCAPITVFYYPQYTLVAEIFESINVAQANGI